MSSIGEILARDNIDVGFKTGVSGAMVELISGALKAFFPIVFFVVNIGFSFALNLVHSTFLTLLKKVRVDFAIDETFFTNNTTQFGRIITAFKSTMIKVALMVIMLIIFWQLFKSLFSYMNFDTDEAVKLAGRAIIFSILIFYSNDIIMWIIKKFYSPMVDKMFGLLYDAEVMGITKDMTLSKMINIILNNVASSLRIDKAAIESLGSFAGLIQGLILIYIDFNVLIVLAKFAERTVVFLLLIIISPIAMACGVSKNTKYIFEGWLKSFLGVLVTYMLYNLVLIMVILFMFLQSGGTIVIGSNAYRFIGNTSFVYATGVILGIFALMDQVETIARELGLNTGGISVNMSSTSQIVGNIGILVANSRLAYKAGSKLVGGFGKYAIVKPGMYVDGKINDALARRNLEKYERALADKQAYEASLRSNPNEEVRGKRYLHPFRKKNNAEKLRDVNNKIRGLEKKKYVAQFKELMPGQDVGEKLKTLGGTKKLAKRLNELKKEKDVKNEIAGIQSKIQDKQDRIKKLQEGGGKGVNKEIAKLKAEIQMDKDKIAVVKNRMIKINDANIKSFGKKIDKIDALISKNEESLAFVNNEERLKINNQNRYLKNRKEFYQNRINEMEKSKNEYIDKFGDVKKGYFYNKSLGEKIKSMPDYLAQKGKEEVRALGRVSTYEDAVKKTAKYAIKGAWKGTKALAGMGFKGGSSNLMEVLLKEAKKGASDIKDWYQDGGDESVKMFAEELKYYSGMAMKATLLPITLQADALNNLIVKPTKGVLKKVAGSKNGEIRVSTIAKDMLTPTISNNMMKSDNNYARAIDISDTVEGNLLLNYKSVESKKARLEDKLNSLERKEGESDLSYQGKVEKLQNSIQRENKKMEKQREQAKMRIEKYEGQREELQERLDQKTKEYEKQLSERRESLTQSDPETHKKYEKQENEIQRMQSKLNKLDKKINVLQEITDGNPNASVNYKFSDDAKNVDQNTGTNPNEVVQQNYNEVTRSNESGKRSHNASKPHKVNQSTESINQNEANESSGNTNTKSTSSHNTFKPHKVNQSTESINQNEANESSGNTNTESASSHKSIGSNKSINPHKETRSNESENREENDEN